MRIAPKNGRGNVWEDVQGGNVQGKTYVYLTPREN